ncbi:hypothetical protein OIU76_022744 [Salix suchowensis]|nr:hypothetical protein OIU76_022744 [Salix suchowensis]
MMKNPRFLTWPKLVLIPDPPLDMAKTGAQLLSWTSLSQEVSPALRGSYRSGPKPGSNGTDDVRSPILGCLNKGRKLARAKLRQRELARD